MVKKQRLVWTWMPKDWPEGMATGYEISGDPDAKGVVLEHVISFNGRLRSMCRAALQEAWEEGYVYIAFGLPHDFPLTAKLKRLAKTLGFTQYDKDAFAEYFVAYR